jgi:hypothetical protein
VQALFGGEAVRNRTVELVARASQEGDEKAQDRVQSIFEGISVD